MAAWVKNSGFLCAANTCVVEWLIAWLIDRCALVSSIQSINWVFVYIASLRSLHIVSHFFSQWPGWRTGTTGQSGSFDSTSVGYGNSRRQADYQFASGHQKTSKTQSEEPDKCYVEPLFSCIYSHWLLFELNCTLKSLLVVTKVYTHTIYLLEFVHLCR